MAVLRLVARTTAPPWPRCLCSQDFGLRPGEARRAAGPASRVPERPRPPGPRPCALGGGGSRAEASGAGGGDGPASASRQHQSWRLGSEPGAPSAERPQRRCLEHRRRGTEPGARRRRPRRGNIGRSSSPVRPPAPPAAGSGSARVSGFVTEGGGTGCRGGRSGRSRGGVAPGGDRDATRVPASGGLPPGAVIRALRCPGARGSAALCAAPPRPGGNGIAKGTGHRGVTW